MTLAVIVALVIHWLCVVWIWQNSAQWKKDAHKAKALAEDLLGQNQELGQILKETRAARDALRADVVSANNAMSWLGIWMSFRWS